VKILYGTWKDYIGQNIANWHQTNGRVFVAPPYSAMCWINDKDEIVASVLFNDYNKFNIDAHICMPGTFSINKIRDIFKYVFEFLKCTRLTAKPKRSNKMVVKLIERLDFTSEATLNEYWGIGAENDALVYVFKADKLEQWNKKYARII
jgi:hypothetical protein